MLRATPRLRAWQEEYDLDVRFRPVYPIAIRTPDFFDQVNPQWFSYFGTDLRRVAEFLELPMKWPSPDPVASRPGAKSRKSAFGFSCAISLSIEEKKIE